MTMDAEREYVRKWAETGRLLERIRWDELRALDPGTALRATDALLDAAVRVPLPLSRRHWSGLVEFQRLLHIGHRP
ncbi:MAG TPA: hypothetical protein VMN81_13960 [Vicinamibacterales bacterium]|nr:hypothetical protein [Vicinamibacterales bacterium]